jgi:hypothetical protein
LWKDGLSKPERLGDCKDMAEVEKYFPEAIAQEKKAIIAGPDVIVGDQADEIVSRIGIDTILSIADEE